MTSERTSLPEYAHPPLVAATLGVYYGDAPSKIDPTSLTEFQHRLGPEWVGRWKEISLEIESPETNFGIEHDGHQLTNVLKDRVVRVQSDLFTFTWLGTADARYPRYENLRDGFVAAWDVWSALHELNGEKAHTWAVSYLNRIPQGTVWQTPADWSFFQLQPRCDSMSTRVECAHWQVRTPELNDTLEVSWMIDTSSRDSDLPAIWVKLTATGDAGQPSSFLDGMDAGRAAIVQTFSDLMSHAANAYWGLRRREK